MSSISNGGRAECPGRSASGWAKCRWLAQASLLSGMPLHCPPIEPPTDSCGSGSCGIELEAPSAGPGSDQLTLRWSAAGPLDVFEVLLQPSEAEPYAPVAALVQGSSALIARGPAWRFDWPSVRVKVRGCAGVECVESNEQPLTQALLHGLAEVLDDPGNVGLFSINIALSAEGNTLAVASSNDSRPGASPPFEAAVYVFQRGEDGRWQLELRSALERYNTGALRLSADGSTLVAGAPDDRSSCLGVSVTRESCSLGSEEPLSGAVYVFARDGAHQWRQQAFIKSDQLLGDLFLGTFGAGLDVVLSADGSWLSVGSERLRVSHELAADFYTRDASGTWHHDSGLTSAELGTTDLVQTPVPELMLTVTPPIALSADGRAFASRVSGVVYAPEVEVPSSFDAVRVFRRDDAGWHIEADIRSPLGEYWPDYGDEGDNFGASLAFDEDGSTLAVGAPQDSSDATGPEGAYASGGVYVFELDGSGWREQAFVKAASVVARDAVGRNVALSADGSVLLAQARGQSARAPGVFRGFTEESIVQSPDDFWGAAGYVFERTTDGWIHRAALLPPAPGLLTSDFASMAMSADGRRVALGSIPYGPDAATPVRSVFVF